MTGALLGIDNSDLVSLKLLGWQSPLLPVFAWLLLALIVGVLLGTLLASLRLPGERTRSKTATPDSAMKKLPETQA